MYVTVREMPSLARRTPTNNSKGPGHPICIPGLPLISTTTIRPNTFCQYGPKTLFFPQLFNPTAIGHSPGSILYSTPHKQTNIRNYNRSWTISALINPSPPPFPKEGRKEERIRELEEEEGGTTKMHRIGRTLLQSRRSIQTWSYDGPSVTLRRKIADIEKMRRKKTNRDKKNELLVNVPESVAFLDTLSMPMVLTAVAVALFAKVLMMYDESKSQEMIERKIRNAPAGQGTVRMLSEEEWENIQEVRPRTPFESKLARPNAQLRTDGPIRMLINWKIIVMAGKQDNLTHLNCKANVKDWGIDVLTDALTRAEETVRRAPK